MHSQENYCRHFAYSIGDTNRMFKYITTHFANINPIIFGISLPPLLLLSRRLEILYGTAFIIKLTFLSIAANAFSIPFTRLYARLLPEKLKLPIDQVSKDGNYLMGPHGLLATYATFYALKSLPSVKFFIPILALGDAILSQNGYWGGYLAGYLAFLMF